jgi:hypothetical protein
MPATHLSVAALADLGNDVELFEAELGPPFAEEDALAAAVGRPLGGEGRAGDLRSPVFEAQSIGKGGHAPLWRGRRP